MTEKNKLNGGVDKLANAFRETIQEALDPVLDMISEGITEARSANVATNEKLNKGFANTATKEELQTTNENMQTRFAKQEESIARLNK